MLHRSERASDKRRQDQWEALEKEVRLEREGVRGLRQESTWAARVGVLTPRRASRRSSSRNWTHVSEIGD